MSQLKKIRKAQHKTLAAVAAQIGVTEATMSRYERQPEKLNLPLLERLSKALGCRISDLAGETDYRETAIEYNTSPAATPTPPLPELSNRRDRETVRRELENIDRLTIRILREYCLTKPDAPDRLHKLDRCAMFLREELDAAV